MSRPIQVGVVAWALLSARPAWPCIIDFASKSERDRMDMSREQALIVWDASARVEHFIRKAEFQGNVKDFGFLVPTPDVPTLAEVDEAVFTRLRKKETTPEVVHLGADETQVGFDWTVDWPLVVKHLVREPPKGRDAWGHRGITDFAARSVEVLSEQKVAGYQTAVLRADQASDLGDWLSVNGYPFSPAVAAWVTPYVRDHWVITAFKIEGRGDDGPVAPRLVRMSFKAQQPVYPYREPPRDPAAPRRELALHLVSFERLGAVAPSGPTDVQTTYSRPSDDLATVLGGAVPAGALAAHPWLTAITDSTQRRPDGELYFPRSDDQGTLFPTEEDRIDRITLYEVHPTTLGLALGLAGGLGLARRRQAPPG